MDHTSMQNCNKKMLNREWITTTPRKETPNIFGAGVTTRRIFLKTISLIFSLFLIGDKEMTEDDLKNVEILHKEFD